MPTLVYLIVGLTLVLLVLALRRQTAPSRKPETFNALGRAAGAIGRAAAAGAKNIGGGLKNTFGGLKNIPKKLTADNVFMGANVIGTGVGVGTGIASAVDSAKVTNAQLDLINEQAKGVKFENQYHEQQAAAAPPGPAQAATQQQQQQAQQQQQGPGPTPQQQAEINAYFQAIEQARQQQNKQPPPQQPQQQQNNTGKCNASNYTQCPGSGCCVDGVCRDYQVCYGAGATGVNTNGPPGSTGRKCDGSSLEKCPESGCCLGGWCMWDGTPCFGRPRM